MTKVQSFLFSLLVLLAAVPLYAQQMKLGEVLITTAPTLKDGADAKAFEAHVTNQMAPAWKKNVRGAELHLFRADRGAGKGNYLMVWVTDAQKRNTTYLPENNASLFPEKALTKLGTLAKPEATYVSNIGAYTDYVLIGADKAGRLPSVDILGIHYHKVKPGQEAAFESFVRDTIYPAMARLFPDMRLLYYKGVRGKDAGNYIALFAIETLAARERYWPTNAPETEILKSAFRPLQPIAAQLPLYLVEGTYLTSANMAAAYFESRTWVDFVHVAAKRGR
jgi:hypothetical protein